MNRSYKVIWNASRQLWMAVGELAKSQGKCRSTRKARPAVSTAVLVLGAGLGLSATPAAAGFVDWVAGSGEWSTGSNWGGGTAPTVDDSPIIANGGVAQLSSGGDETIDSVFVGAGGGSGELSITNGTLTNRNTYIAWGEHSGAVTVSGPDASLVSEREIAVGAQGAAELSVLNGGSVSAGSVTIGGYISSNGNGKVIVDGVGSSLVSLSGLTVGELEASGELTIANGGAISVDNDNDSGNGYFGTLYIARSAASNATVNIGAKAVDVATAAGTLNASRVEFGDGTGKLVFNHSDTNYEFAADIVDKSGGAGGQGAVEVYSGTTIFTGNSSHAGGTAINGGTLQIGNGGASGSIGGDITNHSALVFNRSNTLSHAGSISGTGSVTQAGSGTLILRGNNSYSGGTFINGGTLLVNTNNATGSGAITVNSGTLQIGNGGTHGSIGGDITNHSALVFNRSNMVSHAGNISGTGSVTQAGSGTLILAGNNSYNGGTVINGGTLVVNSSTATGSGAVTVNNGGTLGGSGSIGGAVTVNDGGTLAAGNSPGTLTLANLTLNNASVLDFELDSPAGTAGVDSDLIAVTGDLTLDGILNVSDLGGWDFGTNPGDSGSYTLFTYGGSLTDNDLAFGTGLLAGYNYAIDTATTGEVRLTADYTGLQFWDGSGTADDGVVAGGSGTWDAASSNWSEQDGSRNLTWGGLTAVFAGTAGTVEVDGTHTVEGLQFASDGYVLADSDGNGALQLASGDVEARLDDGVSAVIGLGLTGSGGLTKTGAGTLVLTADQTYTGGTIINGGFLQLGDGGTSGSVIGDIVNNGGLLINRSDDFALNGVISGSGGVWQGGTGTLMLTADQTYTGGTLVSQGTLQIGDGGTSGSLAGDIMLTDEGALVFNRSDTLLFDGVISESGALTQAGAGTLVLTAESTYTGGTTITSGTLQLGDGGTTGSVIGDIVNHGELAFARSDDIVFDKLISGSGSLTQAGNGTLVLATDQTYTGGTTITSGTLQVGDGGTSGSISGNIANHGTLVFNRVDEFALDGDITGAGTIKLASGTTRFSGDLGGYTGALSVERAVLAIADGATLNLGGDYNQGVDGLLRLGASANDSYGRLAVAGAATFADGTGLEVDVTEVNTLAVGGTLTGVVTAGTLEAGSFELNDNSELFNFVAAVNGNQLDLQVRSTTTAEENVIAEGFNPGRGAARELDRVIAGGATGTDMDNVVTALGKLDNQQAVANAVGETLPLLTTGTARAAAAAMSGTNRMIQARQSSLSGLSSGDELFNDQGVWLKPLGSWADQDARDGMIGFEADTYGVIGGFDGELDSGNRLGVALSYMNVRVASDDASHNADIEAYQAIAYGSHSLGARSGLEFSWQADVGRNSNRGQRYIGFMDRTAKADYDSTTGHLGLGVARAYELSATTLVTPGVRADYAIIHDESYTETGAEALSLDVDSNTSDELLLMTEADLSHRLNDNTRLLANLGVGYDLINDDTNLTSSYVGGGVAFTTDGEAASPWLGRAGIGLAVDSGEGTEITLSYDLEGREDFLAKTASAKFRWAF